MNQNLIDMGEFLVQLGMALIILGLIIVLSTYLMLIVFKAHEYDRLMSHCLECNSS